MAGSRRRGKVGYDKEMADTRPQVGDSKESRTRAKRKKSGRDGEKLELGLEEGLASYDRIEVYYFIIRSYQQHIAYVTQLSPNHGHLGILRSH